ncbi:MAG: bifunctional DNA primase/polymerase [Planctomycetaceae bacterium]
MSALEKALEYLRAGLCVLPASLAEKRPTLPAWVPYQKKLPTERQVRTWFADETPLCIVAGAVSGHVEMIDFDHEGELFDRWREFVEVESPGLIERLIVERSQSDGRHVVYRCETPISGNRKLAQRTIVVESADSAMISGKCYMPRRVGERFEITLTLIETRGEGGLFLCAPSPGYVLLRGSFMDLPILSEAERALLIEAACALHESLPPVESPPCDPATQFRPGDDYNERGDVRALLLEHAWTLARNGDNEYWRRPAKDQGWSATLKDRVFYVFSSNAAPFDPDTAYSPFSVYTLLKHNGDFRAAASALRAEGYGETSDDSDVDLSRLLAPRMPPERPSAPPPSLDPGPLPLELCRLPGFVSEVMDHCLETAPYPNVPLAFCGALALQALLAGRKVRDEADNRTNIYLLALAYSAVGKDWPRKLNTSILHRVGRIESLGEKFASGEGIQDALFDSPALLFQTDEIDGLLQSINKSRDARYENIMTTLLTMYSSANSVYPMRKKANQESLGVIDQPCLVLYGTAIPTHYYDALSERMLTNGLFARMLIVESGTRSAGQDPKIINPPPRVLDTAQWWADLRPGSGNLGNYHPQPEIVEAGDDVRALLVEARLAAEAEYALAEQRGDPVGTTVWGRVPEQIRKLALLYAVSADHEAPCIDVAAVRWATAFVLHQTKRMLFMANGHVADNPFHANCLKLLRKLREAPDQTLPHSVLLKRMKIDAKTFHEIVATLEQQGDLQVETVTRAGSSHRAYRLKTGVNLISEG